MEETPSEEDVRHAILKLRMEKLGVSLVYLHSSL